MTDDNSFSEYSEECLEEIANISVIAENFRTGNFGFSKSESATFLNLESTLLKCLDYSWEIDNILEDGELTPFEFDQLSMYINKIDELTNILSKRHKDNKKIINKIVFFHNAVEGLIKESYYLVDNSKGIQPYTREKVKVYSIDETSFYSSLKALNNILVKKKPVEDKNEISKIEREIICLAKIFGTIEEKIAFNTLYEKPTLLLKAFRTSLEIIEVTIMPIYELIRSSYYLEKIQIAKEGLAKIAESEDFAIGNAIPIKGLFKRKGVIGDIEELSYLLKGFN
ncbi:MAG: hypothetical protein KGD64_02795 [Candidatus Heimdallarchaeota archaeon]|nr:hypothetical protein [Candidatus Heimdallarchaeota archaeon]